MIQSIGNPDLRVGSNTVARPVVARFCFMTNRRYIEGVAGRASGPVVMYRVLLLIRNKRIRQALEASLEKDFQLVPEDVDGLN